MTPTEAGLYGFVILIALMFLEIPVSFVMALVDFRGFAFLVSWGAEQLMAQDFFSNFGSCNLTVIPLFVLMGRSFSSLQTPGMPLAQPMSAGVSPGSTASASAGSACRHSRTRRSKPCPIFRPFWVFKGMRTSRGPFC
jgi:hypothetical protein